MRQHQLSISLYLNYFIHGIGLIILTQNMQALGQHWQTPLATVSYVISGIGIGRLLAYFILENLSDRFGRKVFVNLAWLATSRSLWGWHWSLIFSWHTVWRFWPVLRTPRWMREPTRRLLKWVGGKAQPMSC